MKLFGLRSSAFIVLLVATLCAAAAAQNSVTFAFTHYSLSGTQALSVATGDFNNDGMPDLAVGIDSNVAVLLARNPGFYGAPPPIVYYYGVGPTNVDQIAVGDVNGDGSPDLIVRHATAPYLSVLLGNGDGTFRGAGQIALENPGGAIALADFNNDHKADVAVTECVSGAGCSLHVFLSNGDGTFRDTGAQNSTDFLQGGLVAIDLNRDGNADLATVTINPTSVLLYFGNGDGTFSSSSAAVNNPIPAGNIESRPNIVAADFNNDGSPDLAVLAGNACGGSACGTDYIHILLNNGSGTFAEKSSLVAWTSGAGGHLLASDLDNDFNQDLLYWNGQVHGGDSQLFFGNGDGTLTKGSGNPPSGSPSEIAVRDLGHGSRHDLVSTSFFDNGVNVATNVSAPGNCGAPLSGGLVLSLCKPLDGQIVQSETLFPVEAGADSAAGIIRMELWVDGQKIDDVWNDQMREQISFGGSGTHQIAVVAVDRFGTFTRKTISVTAQPSVSTGCVDTVARTVVICAPVNNSSISSPVHVTAAVKAGSSVVRVVQVYIDGVKRFETGPSGLGMNDSGDLVLNTDIPNVGGAHRITVQALDSAGAFKATVFVSGGGSSGGGGGGGTGGGGACPAPSTPGTINICSPVASSTVASPVHVLATAEPRSTAVTVMQIYVDGAKKYDKSGAATIDTLLTLSPGTHRFTVQAVDAAGVFKTVESITVK